MTKKNKEDPSRYDPLDLLAIELYGRRAKPREWLGGSEAKILTDARILIQKLRNDK